TACKGLALCAIERSDFTTAARYYKRVVELEPGITSPPADASDGAEYRISREVLDSLDKTRRKVKSQAAGTTNGSGPR
ncbi:MAG TPA: hypothetical protein VLM42_13130, partial [Bryobacteraceae bacterium]|nr:hypothetical protein [Bryobacteraceae bacterium]